MRWSVYLSGHSNRPELQDVLHFLKFFYTFSYYFLKIFELFCSLHSYIFLTYYYYYCLCGRGWRVHFTCVSTVLPHDGALSLVEAASQAVTWDSAFKTKHFKTKFYLTTPPPQIYSLLVEHIQTDVIKTCNPTILRHVSGTPQEAALCFQDLKYNVNWTTLNYRSKRK